MVSNPASLNWTALLSEHESMLRRVLYARLGSIDEVDEVMQEVALAIVRQQPNVTDPSKVSAYLYQVAVRQALMFRRTMGRRRNLEQRFAERQSDDAGIARHDPLDWLLTAERRGKVRAALEQLSEEDREILLLKHGENMTYSEIAKTLDTTESAVEARLYRGRKRLRGRLAAMDVQSASD